MSAGARRRLQAGVLLLAALGACSEPVPRFHPDAEPLRLSEWRLFRLDDDTLRPVSATLVFRPANQLFTDHAQKLRTLWLPEGSRARLHDGEIDYPVGTVLSKTFYYPRDAAGELLQSGERIEEQIDLAENRLLETRLLVRRDSGWEAFPYVWNQEQNEAFLRVAGTSHPISLRGDDGTRDFVYFVPNENQCAGCHVTEHPDGDLHPLGAIASQLTAALEYPRGNGETQIDTLLARGWLEQRPPAPTPVAWRDQSAPLQDRALAYLNMHCGHCHNPDGAADTSALLLDGSHDTLVNMGVCKTPVAAGGGAGDMLYSIVPGRPERSILLYRMRSSEPDEMMPELGRSLVHEEGVALLTEWIAQLPGACP